MVHKIPSELSLNARRDAIRRPFERFYLKKVTIFRPNIEAASDTTIRANCFGTTDARIAHVRLGFRQLQNRSIARLRLDALYNVDHAAQGRLWKRSEKACVPEHGFFHQRIACVDRNAVAREQHSCPTRRSG